MADNNFITENSTEEIFIEAQEGQISTSESTTDVISDGISSLTSEIEEETTVNITVGEVSGVSFGTRVVVDHNASNPNQHTIGAITGLREELDNIKSLKTVYSNKPLHADYYAWKNGVDNGAGYFVSLVLDNDGNIEIKRCDGSDIFGVSVEDAGFIGGQDATVPRNNSYALVATAGLVDVRCESDVEKDDYVISNAYGEATKTTSEYGYKVVAVNRKHGILYASIALGVQACTADAIGKDLQHLESRVGVNETNIISAVNVANQAYNKVNEIDVSNQLISDKVDDALDTVGRIETDVEDLEGLVSNSAIVSAQAKAIAESAATSAESMKNDAVAEANKALIETSELRKEFEDKVAEIDNELENSALELQATKESIDATRDELQGSIDGAVKDLEELEKDLEPLIAWPDGFDVEDATGIAGFVARANKDSVMLASIVTWKGDAGESLAGFVQEATENNATVKSIASYKRKDANGNVIEPGGAVGLTAQVDANQSELNAVASYEKDDAKGLAGLRAQVDANKSELSVVASYEKGDAKGLAGLVAQVDANKSELSTVANYNKNGKSGLAGLAAYVDEHEASASTLAKYSNEDSGNNGVSGLVADVDDNTSTLSAVVNHEFTKNDGTVVTGLAGLNAYVNENESNVSLVSNRVAGKYTVVDSWSVTDKSTSTVYYAIDTKLYWYYNSGWKSTTDAYVAGLPASTAGIQVVADEHSSKINSLTAFDTKTEINLSRIEQKADANGAYIQSTVANIDKYSVGPHSQAYRFTLEQAASVLEEGMIYVPTEGITETYEYIENEVTKTYERSFIPGYLYKWGQLTDYPYGWITIDKNYNETDETNISSRAVYFTTTEPAISGNFGYWYTNGDTITSTTGTYEPYTLYKWDLPYKYEDENENDVKEYHWVAVATLAGNSSNRAVSQIRQDANSIELRVTGVEDQYVGIKTQLDNSSAKINSVAAWPSDAGTDKYNMALLKQHSDGDGAHLAFAAIRNSSGDYEIDELGGAKIVLSDNQDGSYIQMDADHIDFTADNFTIDADHITFSGQKLNIKVDATNIDGSLTIGQLPDTVAKTDDIPTTTSQLTNDSEFQNETGVVTIIDGRINADYIKTLNLEVGNEIKMGQNATISWNNITEKDEVATTTDVNDAKTEAINSAVSTVDGKGYQTFSEVTQISKDEISTATIRANQVDVGGDLKAFGANIGGWSITENGIVQENVGMLSGATTTYNSLVSDGTNSSMRFYAGQPLGVTAEGTTSITLDENGQFSTSVRAPIPDGSQIIGAEIVSNGDLEGYIYTWNISFEDNWIIISGTGNSVWGGEDGGGYSCPVTYSYTYSHLDNGTPFMVLEDGSLYASNAYIKGNVEMNSGTIGGFTIDGNSIIGEYVGIHADTNNASFAFWAGANRGNLNEAGFQVFGNGKVYVKNIEIMGDRMGLSSLNSNNDYVFWIGKTPENNASAPFRVSRNGGLYAEPEQLGGLTIDDGRLYAQCTLENGNMQRVAISAKGISVEYTDYINGSHNAYFKDWIDIVR